MTTTPLFTKLVGVSLVTKLEIILRKLCDFPSMPPLKPTVARVHGLTLFSIRRVAVQSNLDPNYVDLSLILKHLPSSI